MNWERLKEQMLSHLGRDPQAGSQQSGASNEENDATQTESDNMQARMAQLKAACTRYGHVMSNRLGDYYFDHETVVGVDITPHYIRVCQMKQRYDKWTLTHLASACMEEYYTHFDILGNVSTYAENLKTLIDQNHIKAKNVALSLPVSQSIIKVINLPKMAEEDMADAVALGAFWQNFVDLPGDIQEYAVFYQIIDHSDKVKKQQSAAQTQPQTDPTPVQNLYETSPTISPDASPAAPPATDDAPGEVDSANKIPLESQTGVTDDAVPEVDINALEVPDNAKKLMADTESDATDTLGINSSLPSTGTPTETVQEAIEGITNEINSEAPQPGDNQETEITTDTTSDLLSEVMEPNAESGENHNTEIAEQVLAPQEEDQDTPVEELPIEEAPTEETMDVLFAAIKLEDIAPYLAIIEEAGLKTVVMDVRCFALKHALNLHDEEYDKTTPVGFMEFGADENYICVIHEDYTYKCDILVSDEDKALMSRNVNDLQAFQTFVERYASQAQQELAQLEQEHKIHVKQLYVASSSPLHVDNPDAVPLITTFIKGVTELMPNHTISECNFCNNIQVPEAFAKKVNAEGNLFAWAVTLGLASKHIDLFNTHANDPVADRVNLLPGLDHYKQNERFRILSNIGASTAASIAVVLAGLAYGGLSMDVKKAETELTNLLQVELDYNNKTTELGQLSLMFKTVKSLNGARDSLPSNQSELLEVYKKMSEVIPDGVWLKETLYSMPNTVKIDGNAIDDQYILEFIKRLEETGIFAEISMKNMEAVNESTQNSRRPVTIKTFTLYGDVAALKNKESMKLLTGNEGGA